MNPMAIDHEDAAILANFGLSDAAGSVHALFATTELEKKKVEREDERSDDKEAAAARSERRNRKNRTPSDSYDSTALTNNKSDTLTIGMPAAAAATGSTKPGVLSADEEAAMKNASTSTSLSSSKSTSSDVVRSTVADERARETERKRERAALERDEDEPERRKVIARQHDELRKQRERIEAEQYANYQSAKDKNLLPDESENTWLLRHDDPPAYGCWQGIVTGLCGRNSYPMQGINIVQKMFTP